MALNPQSRRCRHSSRYYKALEDNEEEYMRIPSVIIVPQRSCRVTSSMRQHFEDMPAMERPGAATSDAAGGGGASKPWKVDMARKSYINTRRFLRPNRLRALLSPSSQAEATTASPSEGAYSPNTSNVTDNSREDEAPELDGSWAKFDDGYPSDEENGFGSRRRGNHGSSFDSGSSPILGASSSGARRYGSSSHRRGPSSRYNF